MARVLLTEVESIWLETWMRKYYKIATTETTTGEFVSAQKHAVIRELGRRQCTIARKDAQDHERVRRDSPGHVRATRRTTKGMR